MKFGLRTKTQDLRMDPMDLLRTAALAMLELAPAVAIFFLMFILQCPCMATSVHDVDITFQHELVAFFPSTDTQIQCGSFIFDVRFLTQLHREIVAGDLVTSSLNHS